MVLAAAVVLVVAAAAVVVVVTAVEVAPAESAVAVEELTVEAETVVAVDAG